MVDALQREKAVRQSESSLLTTYRFIIVMIRWIGLAPRKLEFPFPDSLTSTFLDRGELHQMVDALQREKAVRQRERSLLTTSWSESTLSS